MREVCHYKDANTELIMRAINKQCSLISNNSSLPADVNYITDKRLSTVTFKPEILEKSFKILIQTNPMMILFVYRWE